MHILEALEYLIDDVLLVDIFQNVRADYSVQICVHEVEDQVDVAVVFGAHHVLQTDDVLVSGQFLKENNLAEGALRVCSVLESVKVFLECHDFLGALVDCLPHNTVSTLAYTQIAK